MVGLQSLAVLCVCLWPVSASSVLESLRAKRPHFTPESLVAASQKRFGISIASLLTKQTTSEKKGSSSPEDVAARVTSFSNAVKSSSQKVLLSFHSSEVFSASVVTRKINAIISSVPELPPTLNMLPNVREGILEFPSGSSEAEIASVVRQVMKEVEEVSGVEEDSVASLPAHSLSPLSSTSVEGKKSSIGEGKPVVPNDPLWTVQWGPQNMLAPNAWSTYTGGEQGAYRPKVVVIDTGIDFFHVDLYENMWFNEEELNGVDGVDDDGNGYIDDYAGWHAIDDHGYPFDDYGHGTHVAGILGATTNNTIGMAGIHWAPQIIPCKFLNSEGWGLYSDAVKCFDYAIANEALLTSNSWGGSSPSEALEDAINEAANLGILTICASGNDGRDTDLNPKYPASYPNPYIVSVAAINEFDNLAHWSNFGKKTVDLAAPGVDIMSTLPYDAYAAYSGTSMACPHVSGSISLLKAFNPSASPDQLLRAIELGVRRIDEFEPLLKWNGTLDLREAIKHIRPTEPPLTTEEVSSRPQTTTSPPTTSKSPASLSVQLGPSSETCTSICHTKKMKCDNDMTYLINTDVDVCYKSLYKSFLDSTFTKGYGKNQLWGFPSGCYLTNWWSTYRVFVNSYDFGSGRMGCQATASTYGVATKVCMCAEHK